MEVEWKKVNSKRGKHYGNRRLKRVRVASGLKMIRGLTTMSIVFQKPAYQCSRIHLLGICGSGMAKQSKEQLWDALANPPEKDRNCSNCAHDTPDPRCNIRRNGRKNGILCTEIEGFNQESSWIWNGKERRNED